MVSITRRRIAWASGDEALALGGAPDHRRHHVDVLPTELEIARRRTCLEQRLELPGLGPALVVARWLAIVRTSGPALPSGRSAASTGQIVPSPVWSPQIWIRCWPAGWRRGPPRARAPRRARRGRLEGEDHVDVGDVVELVAAALAHRDHGQPSLRGLVAHALAGDRQGGVERGRRKVGQLGSGVVDAGGQWARSRAASRRSTRRYSTRRASSAAASSQRRDRRGGGQGRRRPPSSVRRERPRRPVGWSPAVGRSAHASDRGAGPGARPTPRWPRGRRAGASPCPRRRPAPRASRPARRALSPAGPARRAPGRDRPSGRAAAAGARQPCPAAPAAGRATPASRKPSRVSPPALVTGRLMTDATPRPWRG